MPRFKELKPKVYLSIIIFSLLLFAGSAALAAQHNVGSIERKIFDFIYGWNIGLISLFWLVTQLGSAYVAASAVIVFWWFKKRQLAIKLLIGGGLAYILVEVAKQLVGRQRPYFLLPNVIQRESFVSGSGFPSGHTAMITVLGVIIQPYLSRRYRWLTWLVILAVGVSRIYLGVHLPLDIIGGLATGLAVGYTVRFIQPKLKRPD